MARFWSGKDANGKALTDGRVCYVIESDVAATDPNWQPPIYTYGKDREEVFEKLANTAQTAQSQIHRMRKAPAATPPAAPAARPAAAASTDVAKAVSDLSNPVLAGNAVKTLLRSVGVDVDRQLREDAANRVAGVAEKWEREHPDYPKDPRNDQILMNKAALIAGGALRITAEHLESAYEALQRAEAFHEPKSLDSTVQPGGNPDSRTVRSATSYRRNALRSAEPPPAPRGDSAQEAKWRLILEKGTGKALEDAIRHEAGFAEWVERVTKKKTA